MLTRYEIAATTNGSGAFTTTTDETFDGFVVAIYYDAPASNEIATGATMTLTCAESGLKVLNYSGSFPTADAELYVRSPNPVTNAGAAITNDAAKQWIPVANEKLTMTIASGGDTKSGTFNIVILGNVRPA